MRKGGPPFRWLAFFASCGFSAPTFVARIPAVAPISYCVISITPACGISTRVQRPGSIPASLAPIHHVPSASRRRTVSPRVRPTTVLRPVAETVSTTERNERSAAAKGAAPPDNLSASGAMRLRNRSRAMRSDSAASARRRKVSNRRAYSAALRSTRSSARDSRFNVSRSD